MARQAELIRIIMRTLLFVALLVPWIAVARETPVIVDIAKTESVQTTTSLTARVVARETVLIPAETAETVRSVRARIGDRVSAGDVLATLESENVRLQVETLVARELYLTDSLQLLTEQTRLREQQLERAKSLNTRDLLTRDAKEQAELNLLQTRSNRVKTVFDLKDVQLQLADAKRRLRLTNVTAKRSGRVIAASVNEGQYVRIGDPLFEILPDDGLELDAEVRADAFESLAVGQILAASLRGQPVDVVIRALLAEQNPRTGGRSVRLKFETIPEMPLVVGESAILELPVGTGSELVTVAKDAIMPIREGHRVVVVVDGVAEPRPVVLGSGMPGRIAILSGVSAGDQVVIQGQDGLRKGQKVRVLESDA
jgi:RND family efflux transporter MFP subunit